MQPFYISFLLLPQAYYAATHTLASFKGISTKTVVNYLGNVAATKTKCNEDLAINPQGQKVCYAIKAGKQPSNLGIFSNQLAPPDKSTKLDFLLHLATTKRLTGDQLKEKSPDFVLYTSEADPKCKVVEVANQRLAPSISRGTTYKFTQTTGKTSKTTHTAKTEGQFKPPEFFFGTMSAEAKAKYTKSNEEVTESNEGKTFEAQRDAPCTPFAISYALECQYSNHRKVLFQDGEVVGNYKVTQPLKGAHFIPNPFDGQLAFQVTGCVNLK